jgi:hypothetical protein
LAPSFWLLAVQRFFAFFAEFLCDLCGHDFLNSQASNPLRRMLKA